MTWGGPISGVIVLPTSGHRIEWRPLYEYYTHHSGNGKPDLWETDRPIEADGYMTDLITECAVKFIDQTAAGRPFFIDVAYNAPH
jgi:hypothetical protein